MKKVTLFLSVLIFALSFTSCTDDDALEFGVGILVWTITGKVTQDIPEATEPDTYRFNDDFAVSFDGTNLKIEGSFEEGGQLYMEAIESEEGPTWIVKHVSIENTKTKSPARFKVDTSAPAKLDVKRLDLLSKEINLSFDLIIQDEVALCSIPMGVSFEGVYKKPN